MSHPFETLSDDELHSAVRRLTARSNVALADLLAHLGELETRAIHRSRACASLYTHCIYELRMSEDAAFRRAKAARLVHQHPDLRDVVARGELHLTGLLMIGPYLGGERHTEIIERARFRSKREIARLIAEIDPKPEVPARIEPVAPVRPHRATAQAFHESLAGPVRTLRAGDRPEDWVEDGAEVSSETPSSDDGTRRDVAAVERTAVRTLEDADTERAREDAVAERTLEEADRALELAASERAEAHRERPLRYKVQFTASQEYVELLEEAFALLGTTKKAANLPEVQLRALRELVERLRGYKKRQTHPRRRAPTTGHDATHRPAALPHRS